MTTKLIEVTEDEIRVIRAGLYRAEEASEGDSNDAEIDALWDVLTDALDALGVEW